MAQLSRKEKTLILCVITTLAVFFFTMDLKLYRTVQSTTIVKEMDVKVESWTPFHPLSMKLLMSDHFTHYVITPAAEYFNTFTRFSEVFYFITPNMITFTHFAIGFLVLKCMCSESLTRRRIGVALFEVRTWLDSLDGTVYRARAKKSLFVSDHNNFGFWVDSTTDVFEGFALVFGVLFYLWWYWTPREVGGLPYKKSVENGFATEHHPDPRGKPSKLFLFWVCLCFGFIISFGSGWWDQIVQRYHKMFSASLTGTALEVQTEEFHSGAMCAIIFAWRLLQCQAVQHMLLFSIFIDRVWEFLRFVQYLGIVVLFCLVMASEFHIRHVQHALSL